MNQSFCVYILHCSDGSYYVGYTNNIEQRLHAHKTKKFGNNTYTAKRLPIELVFTKSFKTRSEAQKYERAIKKFSREKREKLILQRE